MATSPYRRPRSARASPYTRPKDGFKEPPVPPLELQHLSSSSEQEIEARLPCSPDSSSYGPMRRAHSNSASPSPWMETNAVGVHSDAGGCNYQEDESLVVLDHEHALLGVFDGHGGVDAARYCREQLHSNVVAGPELQMGDICGALRRGLMATEEGLIEMQCVNASAGQPACGMLSGATVVSLLLRDGVITVGWAGDFGGVELNTRRKLPGLSGKPEMCSRMLLPTDEFAILASDGLWDVLTSQEAVGIARAELQKAKGTSWNSSSHEKSSL
ncbi:MAG: hypothetical protein SGPRY_007190 [Prymnesium sp.]